MSVLIVPILQTCQYLSYQMSVLIILNVKDLWYARVNQLGNPVFLGTITSHNVYYVK